MKVKAGFIVALFLIILISHLIAVAYDLYIKVFWFDLILHFLGGVALGLSALRIFAKQLDQTKPWFKFLIAVMFAVLGSFAWELFEFSALQLFPNLAYKSYLYSPAVGEALSDMLAGLMGGVAAGLINYRKTAT